MLALHENALLTALREHRDVLRLVRTIDTLPRLIGEKLLTKYHADAPALYIVPGRFTVKDDEAVMHFTVAGVVRNAAGHAQARKGDGIDLGCDHLMTLATRALNRQVLGQCSWFLVSGEMADDEVFDIAGISAIEMHFVSSPVALDADYGEEQLAELAELAELADFEAINATVPDQPSGLADYGIWVREGGPPAPPPPPPPQTMLRDNFNGFGSAAGHVPDMGYVGVVWHHQNPEDFPPEATVVADGKCVATVPNVYVSYSPDVYSDFVKSTVTFSFQAEAAFEVNDAGCRGYLVFDGPEGRRVITGFNANWIGGQHVFGALSQIADDNIAGENRVLPVALGDVFEFAITVTDGLQSVSVNGSEILYAQLPVDLTGVKPTVTFVFDLQGWSILRVNAVCDAAAVIPVPPPACTSAPTFNALYWVPPFVEAQEMQPVFSQNPVTLIDLAAQNLVAAGTAHDSGHWCFEFDLVRVWAGGNRQHVGATDITASRSWLYGGIVSCGDLSANLPTTRSVLAASVPTAAEVVSTFADATSISGLDGMTYTGPGSVRLGMEVNIDNGNWAFYRMDDTVLASGQSPEMVGLNMLAAVSSITATPGFYHLQGLYLRGSEFNAQVRPGASPWLPEQL